MTGPGRSVSTDPTTSDGSGASSYLVRLQYVVVGAVLGGLWLWGSGEPAWEHALRTALFVVVLLPVTYYGAQAARARRGRPPLPAISLTRVIATKLALLVLALVAGSLLGRVTTHADQIVAAGLFLVVALGGPRCHHLFVTPSAGAAGPREEVGRG